VNSDLVINKAAQTIAFPTIATKTYLNPPFQLTATASSGLPVSFRSEHDNFISIAGSEATVVGAGSVKIYAAQEGNVNYLPKEVFQNVVINKTTQTIAFNPLPPKKFGDPSFDVSAISSSGLPVTFASSRRTVAKVTSSIITIFAAGTAPIVASQAGNANYFAAANVTQPLVVSTLGYSYPILGITHQGGNGRGTIFNVNTNGSGHTIKKNFSSNAFNAPQSGVIKGSDGKLYGTIMAGGAPSNGVVFSINPDGTEYSVIKNFSFTDGQRPFGNVFEASNGYLYGMTYDGGVNNTGVIFRVKKDGTDFLKLFEFPNAGVNGYHPLGGFIEATNGDLYGMTNEGGAGAYGVLFTIKKDGTGFTKLIDFGTAVGAQPRGDLLQGPDGFLYGQTLRGGAANLGVVFKVKTNGTSYTKLVEFDGAAKGSFPGASLCLGADGKLYGTTQAGGLSDKGTIFTVDTDGSNFTKLLDFDGVNSGGQATGSLILSVDGFLYGMTNLGGASDLGAIFKIKTDGSSFTKLLDFNGINGGNPVFGPMLEEQSGKFYGMSSKGGASNVGVIFSITADGTYTSIKEFPQVEGTPESISSFDGSNYYGVASSGGSNGDGAVFNTSADGSNYQKIIDLDGNVLFVQKVIQTRTHILGTGREGVFAFNYFLFRCNLDGTGFERVVEFNDNVTKGIDPRELFVASDGFVYGTTVGGGSAGHGAIFRIRQNGTGFTKIADVPGGSLGSRPTENLIESAEGDLVGLLHEGGANNSGGVFKVDTSSHQYQLIYSFQFSSSGSSPKKIIQLNDGSLCVANAGGGLHNAGTVITLNADGTDVNKIYDFHTSVAYLPTDLIQTVDGLILGATESGGAGNNGVLFEILSDGTSFKKVFEFNGTNGSAPESIHFRKVEQVISFDGLAQKYYDDPPFALSASSSSGLPITYVSSDPAIASIDGNMVTIHAIGEVTITASTTGSKNFTAAEVQRNLVVLKAAQVITFNELPKKQYNDPSFTISVENSTGLPVTFASSNEEIASIEGNLVTITGVGQVKITASAKGNDNYLSASVEQTLEVAKNDQAISFDAIGDKLFGSTGFSVVATASSSLPIEYSTSDHVSLIADAVTMHRPGRVTIQAGQPGNLFYTAAMPVSQTFCIKPTRPAIGASLSVSGITLTSSSATGNQWYKSGQSLAGETSKTLHVTKSGSYSVDVSIEGCTSVMSEIEVVVITSVTDELTEELSAYPNPATNLITIDLSNFTPAEEMVIKIIDSTGKLMRLATCSEEVVSFVIDELPKGLYIMQVSSELKVAKIKFIKN
jgi:uncharacterized repeat protein (TIGR03803 family)